METHVTGPPVLGELRQHVLAPLLGNSLFSEAELLRANHFVYECADIPRLTRWGENVLAEIARRQTEAARQHCYLVTGTTLRRLRSSCFRGQRARPPQSTPSWAPGAYFPDRADRGAATFDRQAAARFQPADTLPVADLLNRQAR